MERIGVLGSTGMAGHVIATYLEEKGYCVYRASRSEVLGEKRRPLDVTNLSALQGWLKESRLDTVVNCIGLLQNACEARPDMAVFINAYLPHYLEHYATNYRVIHLSTDCVFSGKDGAYREDSLCDGLTMYDRSKALGELHNERDLTFRMSIIGPDIDPKGTGLLNWFLQQTSDIQGYDKAIWNGVTTLELAKAIDAAIQQKLCGLYQLVPQEHISKHDLLQIFHKVFANSTVQIHKVDGPQVNKTLCNTRTDFDFYVQDYRTQIEELYKWMKMHMSLYPHYHL